MSVSRRNAIAGGESTATRPGPMTAIVQDHFGPPDTLRLVDADKPEIGSGEVLLKVHAAAVNPYDWHMVRGDPQIARLMGGVGVIRPKTRIAGVDVAGRVAEVGADVPDLRPGDEVFGFARGAFAEYATADAALVAPKPPGLSFEQAAAMPMAAVTALHAIRDRGRVQPGQRVLVNGAAGGVGTFAVQIAAALGAEVTGVCSARNADLVRSIGAAHIVDYASEDFADPPARFDVILDNVGNRTIRDLRRAVTPSGTVIVNGGGSPGHIIGAVGSILRAATVNLFVRQRITMVPTAWSRADLLAVAELVEAGTLRSVIDRSYPLAETVEGLRYVEAGHARGKVVIAVS
ncbi:MAG TPA: NAD(P)-dependent alcohol dehydrogenase [Nakamurella sp.]